MVASSVGFRSAKARPFAEQKATILQNHAMKDSSPCPFKLESPMISIASTVERVPANTAPDVNETIRRRMEARVARYAQNLHEIDQRLAELDREWDIERALETLAPSFTLGGVVLGTLLHRKWLLLPLLVNAFLLQHALEGWCPPLPVLRRLGFRTATEIEEERYALKALRGDFCDRPFIEQRESDLRPQAWSPDDRCGR